MKRDYQLTFKAFMIFMLIFSASCSKDRPVEMVQSADFAGLFSINSMNGKTCQVDTAGALYTPQGLSRASTTQFEDQIYNDNLPFVSYETNCPLMKDLPFRGRPRSRYVVKFKIKQTPSEYYLEAYKVTTEENISFHEKTFSDKIDQTHYEIPLFRHKINFYSREFVTDPITGEKTQNLDLFPKNNMRDATDFRIAGERVLMKAVVKEDILPARYFEGDWFFAYTVVSAHYENASSIGSLSSDFDFDSKSRVKFVSVENGLQVVSTSVSTGVNQDQIENLEDSLFLPARWVDFRVSNEGPHAGFEEEVLDNDHIDSPDFRSRNYVAIDYARAKSKYTEQNRVEEGYFEDLSLTRDYISFTILYPGTKQKIKYSLKRAPAVPKKPMTYHFDDMKYFGYLFTIKNEIEDARLERPEDYEALNMIQRFYPDNNVIKFHISSQTPRKYFHLVQQAIDAWQDAFDEAYLQEPATNKMRIELVADRSNPTRPDYETVSVGDIRYNIINIIDSLSGNSLLGYGPSIVDSESGEIISATSNVYVHPTRDHLINVLRNYVRMKLGVLKTTNLMHFKVDGSSTEFFNNHYAPSVLKRLRRNQNKTEEQLEEERRQEREQAPTSLNEYRHKYNSLTQRHFNFQETQNYNIERIETQCEDTFKGYFSKLFHTNVESLHGEEFDRLVADYNHPEQDRFYVENEIQEFNSCLEKLIQEDLLVTLIHELGHNFGLAHNFMGSVDQENYTLIGDKLLKTSSVMDYLPVSVEGGVKVGKYDIAALRYSYLKKIQGYDLNIWQVEEGQSIDDWRRSTNRIPKEYKFCSDDEIYKFDPMCAPNDYGATPLEIVKNIISGYHAFVTIFGQRYDRYFMLRKSKYLEALDIKFFTPLKMYYETWRSYLGTFLDDGNKYLDRDSTNTKENFIRNALEAMKNSANNDHVEFYHNYYEATVLIHGFLESLLKEPSKYCLAVDSNADGMIIPIDFESMRKEIFQVTNETINTCDHEFVLANLNSKRLDQHPLKEFGSTYNDLTFSLDERERDEYDRVFQYGIKHSKALAMTILTSREPELETLRKRNFRPNFFDNPIYRERMHNFMMRRALQGVDFKIEDNDSFTLPFFSREKNFLIGSTDEFIKSLVVPGKDRANNATVIQYRGYSTTVADLSAMAESERQRLIENRPSRSGHYRSLPLSNVLSAAGINYKEINNDHVLFAYEDAQPHAYSFIDRYLLNEEYLTIINFQENYMPIFDFEETVFTWTNMTRETLLQLSVDDFLKLYDDVFKKVSSFNPMLKEQIESFYIDLSSLGYHIIKRLDRDDLEESARLLSVADFYTTHLAEITTHAESDDAAGVRFYENIADYRVPSNFSRRTISNWLNKVTYALFNADFGEDLTDQIDILHAILSSGRHSDRNNYVIDVIGN